MIKLVLAVTIFFLFCGCDDNEPGKRTRRQVIDEALVAISKYDTLRLYDLIDTSHCFKIYGREGFLQRIENAHSILKECGKQFNDSAISIEKVAGRRTEYTLSYCPDTLLAHGKLVFAFADFRNDEVIDFFSVAFRRNAQHPTLPLGN
jgi:hypothetical protein